jgi:hypothetical protein
MSAATATEASSLNIEARFMARFESSIRREPDLISPRFPKKA